MRNRTLVLISSALAFVLWLGLILFMNVRYPDSLNQLVFLVIWWAAVSTTAMPIAYALNGRAWGWRERSRLLGRATRQGILVGLLATVLMALRFMRVLNAMTAILLVMVTVAAEVLANLRRG